MGRYRSTYPLDEAEIEDGDRAFYGVNSRMDPAQLPAGIAASAINMRFSNGIAEPRKGIVKLPWSNRVDDNDDTKVIPFNVIYGVAEFNDPDDRRWLVIAADGKVYVTRENNLSREVSLPPGVSITYDVEFEQALGQLIMFRGETRSELVMSDVDAGFSEVGVTDNEVSGASTENPSDGTHTIPHAARGLYLGNRLFIPYERDLVAVSDFLNFTRYQPVRSAFRINQGSSDKLVTLFKFDETTVIVAKEESIYRVFNVYGDLSLAVLDEVTRQYGCRAPRTFVQAGADVWFLADRRGVSSIRRTDEGKLQAVDIPVSEPIEPLIRRINWRLASGACAEVWDNKYYLAVPFDDGRVIRANIIPGAVEYVDGSYSLAVTPGRRYRWVPGVNEVTLINGTETLTQESDFIAQSASVTLTTASEEGLIFEDDFNTENDAVSEENYTGWANWTVDPGLMDLIGPDYSGWADFADAMTGQGMFVDTRGTGSAIEPTMTSKETFDLTAGVTYTLRFKLAGSQRGTVAWVRLVVGSLLNELIMLGPDEPLREYIRNLQPESNMSVSIEWRAASNSSNLGLLLDDINLSGPAPGSTAVTAQVLPVLQGNNAVLVYDFLTQQWAGYDFGGAILIKQWVKHTYGGVERLFFASLDGYLNLYEETFEDDVGDENDQLTIRPIETELITRGYAFGSPRVKRFARWEITANTWAPNMEILGRFDGAFEETALDTITKDRTKYYRPHDAADYDTTNINDDHATPYREDYSVVI
jgi:hypothetical protein